MVTEWVLNAVAAGRPLKHFWNFCVGAGRANEGLRADWQEHLRLVKQWCGFRYVRFHGLFHDDMFVYRIDADGHETFNFQYVDALFDRLLDAGIRPFVELGFCPGDLAREKGTVFWWNAHGSPPKDYDKWAELVRRTVRHWVDRYGADEVRDWYFEVWNEPNLHPFFKGTKSEYFALYKKTAEAVKSIDVSLRVGGPATSNFVPDARFADETENFAEHAEVIAASDVDSLDWKPVWLAEFLEFCARERLPVDFVSCHPYPTDWALDAHGTTIKRTRGVQATPTDLALLRKMVNGSDFPHAEIHLTEWSSSPSPRDHTHDHLQAATFVAKANIESIGLVDSMSYWVFTDVFEESGAGDTAFHGGFGMVNLQGIPKPVFHAYRLLNELGDEILQRFDCGIATRQRTNGKIAVLAYHYPTEESLSVPASFDSRTVAETTLSKGKPFMWRLRIESLQPHVSFLIETLDLHNGNAIAGWHAIGQPCSPTHQQTTLLKQVAWETRKQFICTDASGTLLYETAIDPWSIVSVRQL